MLPELRTPHLPNPALDEHSHVIEVEVKAHVRRIRRPAYTRNPGCTCENTPAIITASPPPRLIPRSDYGVSFLVEVLLSKCRYAQPSNRHLQDLKDQGLPVSPGTLAGGLQALAPLFKPVLDVLYRKQMTEELFHNDETRWEVFVEVEGKVGTRWYLWMTRSPSVIYYCIDPSRSAAAPRCRVRISPACRPSSSLSCAIVTAPTRSSLGWRRTFCSPSVGKNYYGSGSIWSAELAAMLFAILQTMVLWGINPRHWLTCYLTACAQQGGRAPQVIDPFLP